MRRKERRERDQVAASAPSMNLTGEITSLHQGVVAYAKAASAREETERRLGAASTASSSIVALSIFGSLSASPNAAAKVAAGCVSALAAVCGALEKFSTKAPSSALSERAGDYSRLLHTLRIEGDTALARVYDRHDELIAKSPTAGDKYWKQARAQVTD